MDKQNQQPIQEKTETKPPIKTSWKFIAIVVVLGLVVGGLVTWYRKSISESPASGVSFTKPPLQEGKEKIDTAGWQTYRNEEFGFEVRYP